MPAALHETLDQLADAVALMSTELAKSQELADSKTRLQIVARSASEGLIGTGGFSTGVVLAQLRSTVVELLQATGMIRSDAVALLPVLSLAWQAADSPHHAVINRGEIT